MSKQEIKCCVYCGRDTRSKAGVCWRCNGYYPSNDGNKDRVQHEYCDELADMADAEIDDGWAYSDLDDEE